MERHSYVYVMTNRRDGTIYIGVTSNLVRRVWQHRTKAVAGFTSKYRCTHLVYFEVFEDIREAIAREKAMKKWNRAWKVRQIEGMNPDWHDLWVEICRP